ncbi:MAG: YqhA family protein [Gemmatimonadales bacterium]
MSRFSIGLAVIGTFVGATALMAYGVLETIALVDAVIAEWLGGGEHATEVPPLLAGIGAVDTFLIGMVLYFIAVGLYQLSFHPLPLPQWLIVDDLGDLEDKLVKVVVLVLGIAFLGQVVTWDGQRDLLGFGVATALVIAALGFHLRGPSATPPRISQGS